MIQPRLTPQQLNDLEQLCMSIVVHPNNGVQTVGKENVTSNEDWAKLQTRYEALVNAGTVLSLIQQIKGINNPKVYR